MVFKSGKLLAVVMLSMCLLAPWQAHAAPSSIYRIVVDGPITPSTQDFIGTAIDRAEEAGAAALLIELDTPGGHLFATKAIVKRLLSAPLPVLVYVSPAGAGAISAGVFLTMAGHIAAMAPGTTIGAAHPVGGQGEDIAGDMREKVENFTASFGESIAEQRGRNVEWAEKAVRESVAVTEGEAVELNIVDFVAEDISELLEKSGGREVRVAGKTVALDFSDVFDTAGRPRVIDFDKTLRHRVLDVITHPNIAYLLMMAGMLGLYIEFSNPGAIFPGVAGAICLLLALLAAQVLPISSTGVVLLVLGMAFLLGELFMPSFGVLGFGGLVAITLGSLFLYTKESALAVDRSLVTATVAMFAAIVAAIVILLLKDRRKRPSLGIEGLVGEVGKSVSTVHESGKVKLHGELWNACSDESIESGRRVKVLSVDGLRVKVKEEDRE